MRRRELLLAAAAVPLAAAAPARAQMSGPARLIAEALRRERECEAFYSAATDLRPAAAFAAHEAEQARLLTGELLAFGGQAPGAVQIDVSADGSPAELAARAIGFEEAALDAHDALLRATDESALLGTVTSIMAAAGTHLAVLRPLAATL